MHLEQADAVLREKANLFSVLEREQKKSVADIENLHDLYQAGQIDKYGFGAKYHPWAERQRQLDDEIPKVQAELDVLKIAQLSQEEIISEARDPLHPVANATGGRETSDRRNYHGTHCDRRR